MCNVSDDAYKYLSMKSTTTLPEFHLLDIKALVRYWYVKE